MYRALIDLRRFDSTHLLVNFLINMGIAVFLTMALLIRERQMTPWEWLLFLLVVSIYSNCIGFLVGTASYLYYRHLTVLPAGMRLLLLNLLFVASGVVGAALTHQLVPLIFSDPLPEVDIGPFTVSVALICGFIAASFGNLVFVYDLLRSRWVQATGRLKEQEVRAERLQKLKAEAELGSLQARIHPHFLFNTLNSIASLVRENPELAEQVIEKLAGLFRYSLASHRGRLVTLQEELQCVSDYLEIEKVRLGERLQFSIEAAPDCAQVLLPGLLVQPLVENSVQHGIGPREAGGEIRVRAWMEGKHCCIEVTDDGLGFSNETSGNGYALENIRGRLEALHPGAFHFEVTPRPEGGTRALLRIPATGGADP